MPCTHGAIHARTFFFKLTYRFIEKEEVTNAILSIKKREVEDSLINKRRSCDLTFSAHAHQGHAPPPPPPPPPAACLMLSVGIATAAIE